MLKKTISSVFWMIKNQEKSGGISIHKLTKEIDAGPIQHFEPYTLSKHETFGSYMHKMALLNVKATHNFLTLLLDSKAQKLNQSQSTEKANYYSKPTLKDVSINWEKMTSNQIHALCRACNPWNKGAIAYLEGNAIKLVEVETTKNKKHNGELPGTILVDKNEEHILISTCDLMYLKLNIVSIDEGIFGPNLLMLAGIQSGGRFS